MTTKPVPMRLRIHNPSQKWHRRWTDEKVWVPDAPDRMLGTDDNGTRRAWLRRVNGEYYSCMCQLTNASALWLDLHQQTDGRGFLDGPFNVHPDVGDGGLNDIAPMIGIGDGRLLQLVRSDIILDTGTRREVQFGYANDVGMRAVVDVIAHTDSPLLSFWGDVIYCPLDDSASHDFNCNIIQLMWREQVVSWLSARHGLDVRYTPQGLGALAWLVPVNPETGTRVLTAGQRIPFTGHVLCRDKSDDALYDEQHERNMAHAAMGPVTAMVDRDTIARSGKWLPYGRVPTDVHVGGVDWPAWCAQKPGLLKRRSHQLVPYSSQAGGQPPFGCLKGVELLSANGAGWLPVYLENAQDDALRPIHFVDDKCRVITADKLPGLRTWNEQPHERGGSEKYGPWRGLGICGRTGRDEEHIASITHEAYLLTGNERIGEWLYSALQMHLCRGRRLTRTTGVPRAVGRVLRDLAKGARLPTWTHRREDIYAACADLVNAVRERWHGRDREGQWLSPMMFMPYTWGGERRSAFSPWQESIAVSGLEAFCSAFPESDLLKPAMEIAHHVSASVVRTFYQIGADGLWTAPYALDSRLPAMPAYDSHDPMVSWYDRPSELGREWCWWAIDFAARFCDGADRAKAIEIQQSVGPAQSIQEAEWGR